MGTPPIFLVGTQGERFKIKTDDKCFEKRGGKEKAADMPPPPCLKKEEPELLFYRHFLRAVARAHDIHTGGR